MLEFYVIAWALASLTKFAYKYITCESIRIHDQNQILIDSHYHIAAVRYNKTRNRFHVRCQHTSMSERQTKQQIRNIRIHEEKVRVRFTHCRRIGLVVWCIVHRWRRTKKKSSSIFVIVVIVAVVRFSDEPNEKKQQYWSVVRSLAMRHETCYLPEFDCAIFVFNLRIWRARAYEISRDRLRA